MVKIFLFILFCSVSVQAQVGTSIDAMGGAGIGAIHPLESPVVNAAAIAQLKEYYSGAQYFRKNYLMGDNLDQYSFMASDSGPGTLFPGGFVYRHRAFDLGNQRIRENFFLMAAAFRATKKLSFGLSGYHQRTNMDTQGDYSQTNADLSVFMVLTENLTLGLVQKSLFGSKTAAVAETQFKPATGAGVQYNVMGILNLRGDIVYNYEDNPNDRFTHSGGVEFLMANDFILRTGYRGDDYKGEGYYTLGLGWNGPRLKIAYAYQDEVRHNLATAHTVDIWLNF